MTVDKRMKYEMQGGVKNYLGNQKQVKVPVNWQSGPTHPKTELAYITKKEKDLLIKKDLHNSLKGGANRGPSGIISLNGWGSSDSNQNQAGANISAAMDRSPSNAGWNSGAGSSTGGGMSPAQLSLLAGKKGSSTTLPASFYGKTYKAPKSGIMSGKFNPLSLISGLFTKNPLGILANMFGKGFTGLSGKMRGINPETGEPNTQAEYEAMVANRKAVSRLDKLYSYKDKGNIFGGEFTEGQQGKIDALEAQGVSPTTARDVLTGRDKNLRGILDSPDIAAQAIDKYPNPIGPYGIPPASEYEGMWDGRGVNVPGKYEQAETDYWSDKQVINTPGGEIVIDSEGNEVVDTPMMTSKSKPQLTMMEEFYNNTSDNAPIGFVENLQNKFGKDVRPAGMNQEQIDYLNSVNKMNVDVGNTGAGKFYTYNEPQEVMNRINKLNSESDKLFGGINPDKIVTGDKSKYAQPKEVYDYINSLQPSTDYNYGQGTIGIKDGGRIRFADGGLATLFARRR